MKPFTIVLILLALFASSNIFAREADTMIYAQIPNEIKKTLTNQIYYPVKASNCNIEGTVAVCFTISAKGIININCINGPEELKTGVYNNLNELKFPNNLSCANKPMVIKYSFVKQ